MKEEKGRKRRFKKGRKLRKKRQNGRKNKGCFDI